MVQDAVGSKHPPSNFPSSKTLLESSVESLKSAFEPLRRESWLRNFMLQRDNPAVDLDVLSAPVTSGTSFTFSSVSAISHFQNTTFFSPPPHMPPSTTMLSCALVDTHLMVPCATVGPFSVGLVVKREKYVLDMGNGELGSAGDPDRAVQQVETPNENLIGRFYFCNDTGALLILVTNFEQDSSQLARCHDSVSVEPTNGPRRFLSARKSHVMWWPPITARTGSCFDIQPVYRELFCGIVLTELLERDLYEQCILFAASEGQVQRNLHHCNFVSETPVSHDTGQGAGSDALKTSTHGEVLDCMCRERLQTSKWVYDFETVLQNVRQEVHGSWMGPTSVLARIGPQAFRVTTAIRSVSNAFGGTQEMRTLGSQLLRMIMHQLTSSLKLARLNIEEPERREAPRLEQAFDGNIHYVSFEDGSFVDTGDLVDEVITGRHAELKEDVSLCYVQECNAPFETASEDVFSSGPSPLSCPEGARFSRSDMPGKPFNSERAFVNCETVEARTAADASSSGNATEKQDTKGAERAKRVQTTLDRRDMLAARRQRNKASATRSNREKAAWNEALRNDLRDARRRMEQLKAVQRNLRAKNVELCAQVQMLRMEECGTRAGKRGNTPPSVCTSNLQEAEELCPCMR